MRIREAKPIISTVFIDHRKQTEQALQMAKKTDYSSKLKPYYIIQNSRANNILIGPQGHIKANR